MCSLQTGAAPNHSKTHVQNWPFCNMQSQANLVRHEQFHLQASKVVNVQHEQLLGLVLQEQIHGGVMCFCPQVIREAGQDHPVSEAGFLGKEERLGLMKGHAVSQKQKALHSPTTCFTAHNHHACSSPKLPVAPETHQRPRVGALKPRKATALQSVGPGLGNFWGEKQPPI